MKIFKKRLLEVEPDDLTKEINDFNTHVCLD